MSRLCISGLEQDQRDTKMLELPSSPRLSGDLPKSADLMVSRWERPRCSLDENSSRCGVSRHFDVELTIVIPDTSVLGCPLGKLQLELKLSRKNSSLCSLKLR